MAKNNGFLRRNARALVALAALGLTGAGCATSHAKVDDSSLAKVPQSEMQSVNSAQAALHNAQQQAQQVKEKQKEAENRVTLAKKEQEVAKAQYDQARAQTDIQKKAGQQLQLGPDGEPVALHEPKLAMNASKAKVDYVQSLKDIADKQAAVADKQVNLQKANVEMAKFEALQRANPQEVQKKKMTPADFQARVANANADVSKAEADLQRARQAANQNYEAWMQMERQTTDGGQRRANVPPPPRGMPTP